MASGLLTIVRELKRRLVLPQMIVTKYGRSAVWVNLLGQENGYPIYLQSIARPTTVLRSWSINSILLNNSMHDGFGCLTGEAATPSEGLLADSGLSM